MKKAQVSPYRNPNSANIIDAGAIDCSDRVLVKRINMSVADSMARYYELYKNAHDFVGPSYTLEVKVMDLLSKTNKISHMATFEGTDSVELVAQAITWDNT